VSKVDLCYHPARNDGMKHAMNQAMDLEGLARGFLAALRAGLFYDPPSASVDLEVAHAYALQQAFNALRAAEEPVAGYKAGVNSEAAQRALGLDGPVTGVLFASGGHRSGERMARSSFRNLVIETELGFRAARRIDRPLEGMDDLRSAIATVAPMFELADPGFGRVAIRGTDMIATNLACGGFVEGAGRPIGEVDINAVSLVLERDGVALHEARATDLGGDHWQALRWLIDSVIARGLVIEAGQLLMTGALGPAQPATPGVYRADFGALGVVEATIV
jgi:2-keto-4-pentenoate hydratase